MTFTPLPYRPRIDSVVTALGECSEAYFVTLTTERDLESLVLTEEVRRWMRRLNQMLFGTAFRRKGLRLVSYAVQELTGDQRLHAHLVLGLLPSSRTAKAHPSRVSFAGAGIDTWCALGPGRLPKAQNIQPSYDVPSAVDYVSKHIRNLGAADRLDILNMHLPDAAWLSPRDNS